MGNICVSFLDDSESKPTVLSSEALDIDVTRRVAFANIAKELLSPYYNAAVMRVPLLQDNPTGFFGRAKYGLAKALWTATITSPHLLPRTMREVLKHDFALSYTKTKTGNTMNSLIVTKKTEGGDRRNTETSTTELQFEDGAVKTLTYTTPLVGGLCGIDGYAFNLDPANLSITVKSREEPNFAVTRNKCTTVYRLDTGTGNFVMTDNNALITKVPERFTKTEFIEMIEKFAEESMPLASS
jgi:hypothetical protein